MKLKTLILIFIFSIFISACDREKLLSIHIIDVGQGDSILIKTPKGKNILVDSGDEDCNRIVKSYLKKNKVKNIDLAIATHPDSDHIGSFDYIIDNFNINEIYMPKQSYDSDSYKNLITSCNNKNLSINYLYKDNSMKIEDDLYLYVLSPSYINTENNNLNSIVFNLTYKSKSFLFTGDAELQNEQDILSSYNISNIDFLKVAHHGSKTSSNYDFLKAMSPDVAAISCGYKNKFGHPHKATLDSLNKLNIPVYRTDLLGDIVFYSDGLKIFTKKKYNLIKSYLTSHLSPNFNFAS